MSYPRYRRARAHRFTKKTSGNTTYNSASWGTLDAALDLSIEAQLGDTIEVAVSATWGAEAVNCRLDVCTLVAGAPVNYFGGAVEPATGDGVGAWYGKTGEVSAIGGPAWYTIQAGDLENGRVTLRLRARCDSATLKTIFSNANLPLHVAAKNLGPADPE